ncbi:MFS transporter [Streptomyces sp. Z26]|uniref:MFS transporter n=1 Tax=Streptomyces sp. Z26 TaxID=2500177 RepID=UPI000EF1756F|nr:MFS transporter [Streptomyces sp. Z26]RLL69450.1 MFS transporter [Streptomyces sp. Z26]
MYALLFADAGLSAAQISSLFALWSATSVALEVPSGLWADRCSRRRLLVLAPLVTGTGFALWTFWPSYGSFAAGFVLWGAGGSLRSGTVQALVYEELARVGDTAAYARLAGRARSAGTSAEMAATALAAPVVAAGGHRAAGVASVLVCVAGAAVALRFPERRALPGRAGAVPPDAESPDPEPPGVEPAPGMRRLLRAGLAEVRGSRAASRALLLASVLAGLLAYEEYVPLLAVSTGAADATVPLLLLAVSTGALVGGWYAGRGARLLAPGLAAAACALACGALSGHPAGLLLVGAAYGLGNWAEATAEARLQDRLTDRTRATVGSLAGLGAEAVSVLVFAGYALGSAWSPPGPLLALVAVAYLALAWALRRRA